MQSMLIVYDRLWLNCTQLYSGHRYGLIQWLLPFNCQLRMAVTISSHSDLIASASTSASAPLNTTEQSFRLRYDTTKQWSPKQIALMSSVDCGKSKLPSPCTPSPCPKNSSSMRNFSNSNQQNAAEARSMSVPFRRCKGQCSIVTTHNLTMRWSVRVALSKLTHLHNSELKILRSMRDSVLESSLGIVMNGLKSSKAGDGMQLKHAH